MIVGDRGRLETMQAGRGIAALFVVAFHATILIAAPSYWHSAPLGGAFAFGWAGVDFFFVLSGFIILYAHRRDLGRPGRLGRYLFARGARIYPLYWIVTAAVAAALLAQHRPIGSPLMGNLLLVGRDTTEVLAVAWTLFQEIVFYAVFAVAIVSAPAGVVVLGLWSLACLAFVTSSPPHYALSPINLIFVMGLIVALTMGRIRFPGALLAAGSAAFVAVGIAVDRGAAPSPNVTHLLFGAAAAAAVSGAVALEQRGAIRLPRGLVRLGDASYALYLIHFPLIAIAAQGIRRIAPTLPIDLIFVVLVAVSVAAAVLVHDWIERPILRRLARLRGDWFPAGSDP